MLLCSDLTILRLLYWVFARRDLEEIERNASRHQAGIILYKPEVKIVRDYVNGEQGHYCNASQATWDCGAPDHTATLDSVASGVIRTTWSDVGARGSFVLNEESPCRGLTRGLLPAPDIMPR